MGKVEKLLTRLEEIGRSLEASGRALALIGLGSVGVERQRLDEYSDLDFFAIVQDGQKQSFIDNLSWLSSIAPVVYQFRNTTDGYKLLFEDGIFCEFAVFEPWELEEIPYAEGQVVWKADGIQDDIRLPKRRNPPGEPRPVEWLVGEALTCLYVGLGRWRRGEKLSGTRFVQEYAVDRLVELAPYIEREQNELADEFVRERRFEQRFPMMALSLGEFVQGYERTPQSALAILEFLEKRFPVNPALREAIVDLIGS